MQGHIGQGDLGVVRLAHDERLDRTVAIKILTPESAGDDGFRARLLHRVQAAAEIEHPRILPVYAAWAEADGTVYIAMRYAPGGDARSLLRPPLPLGRAWKVIAQAASALDAAHARGVIHRDVKPANMLLEASDVYLADFGMGREWPPDEITAAARFAGTLDYAAPEQIQGRTLDERTDLYSLACAGYELLCGTPPFGPDEGLTALQDEGLTALYAQLYAPPPAASTRRPDLPAPADAVLATALAKNPADRYESCGQFAEELRKALGLVSGSPFRSRLLSNAVLASGGDPRAAVSARSLSWPYEAAVASSPDVSAAPDEPDPRPHGPDPRPRWRRPRVIRLALAGAAVAVAAGLAIGVALSGRSAAVPSPPVSAPAVSSPVVSPPPVSSPPVSSPSAASSPSAFTQAAAVNDVLTSSTVTLKALQGAVSEVFDCTNLSGAARQIQDVVDQRSTEYAQASALSTSALADGTIVKSDLIAALRSSLDADKDFLTWARQQLNPGCTPAAQSSAYNAAENASQQAGVAKQAFVEVWNPVAARYGIQQKPPGSF